MEKFIPYEKLSKKAKRELDSQKRGSWGALNPVTRVPPNPKAYKRKKQVVIERTELGDWKVRKLGSSFYEQLPKMIITCML